MALFGERTKGIPNTESEMTAQTAEKEADDMQNVSIPNTDTLISKEVMVVGSIHGKGSIQVEGTVEGDIRLKGSLVVAPSGQIRGPVEADVIRIAGHVEGDITAHHHLRLERAGMIDGDVTTSSFVIDEGGRLNGRATMAQPEPEEQIDAAVPDQEELQFGPNYQIS